MFEILAGGLQSGDVFTLDDGATWLRVKRASRANRGKKVVVIDDQDKEHVFGSEQLVVVK